MSIFGKKYVVKYRNLLVDVRKMEYTNGRIALQANLHKTQEPFATLTTNIPSYDDILDKKDIIVDSNNVPGIDRALMEAGLIGDCKGRLQSGWCTYPVHEWLG